MLKGILFDFDKTLVNLADFVDWEGAIKEIREFYRKSGVGEDDLKNHSTTFKMMEKFGKKPQASKILEKFEMRGVQKSVPMPNAIDALSLCKSLSLKIAIVSLNSRNSIKASMDK
ncbi:MAG: HAD hydrolase-like protein, partial [Candidatus Aenigmarchaeota archaeon]|nr:HAD hydrolase-like protein [Candidatus Aenigmarchaeota archaeon]